jgi:hypothetical protein
MAGEICFNRNNFYLVIIVGLSVIGYVMHMNYLSSQIQNKDTNTTQTQEQPQQVNVTVTRPESPNRLPTVFRDLQRIIHPLIPPTRRGPFSLNYGQGVEPGRSTGYINIPTRGEYGPFHQIGFLNNKADPEQTMQLIGRKIHSNQYEYYTFHHLNPNVKIPLKIRGGRELYSDDSVTVPSYSDKFTVNKYDIDSPRYIAY